VLKIDGIGQMGMDHGRVRTHFHFFLDGQKISVKTLKTRNLLCIKILPIVTSERTLDVFLTLGLKFWPLHAIYNTAYA